MNKFIRKFNQNRNMIFLDIFIVISVIIAIYFVNGIFKKKHQEEAKNMVVENTTEIIQRTPAVTDKEISKKTNESNINIIDNFIKLCNEQNPKDAYNLISEDCKKEVFPTEQIFINNYYSKIFNAQRQYKYESWSAIGNSYTYKIKLYNDDNLLSTGGANTTYVEEYYTIVRNSKEEKLNINNFINKNELNVENSSTNISIKVKEVAKFFDYETYTIEVKNKTNKEILLDSKEKTNTMYLLDENQNKYVSYSHEIANDKLWLRAGETRSIKIKFTKSYSSEIEIKGIVFSDIILDYNEYKNTSNKSEYKDREKIGIKF